MVLCKRCYAQAEKLGMVEAVKKLAARGWWICPFLKSRCGKASA
jgi:hypothetical protein